MSMKLCRRCLDAWRVNINALIKPAHVTSCECLRDEVPAAVYESKNKSGDPVTFTEGGLRYIMKVLCECARKCL